MRRWKEIVAAVVVSVATMSAAVPARAEFFGWQVVNVPAWDVLNVRAWPSSISQILVGYPAGTPLSLTGKCTNNVNLNQINGWPAPQQTQAVRFSWCEVWVDPQANGNFRIGWVYGRYIAPL